jgi:hypothetical protein
MRSGRLGPAGRCRRRRLRPRHKRRRVGGVLKRGTLRRQGTGVRRSGRITAGARAQQNIPVRARYGARAFSHHDEHQQKAERRRLSAPQDLLRALAAGPAWASSCVLCVLDRYTHNRLPIPSCPHSTPHTLSEATALGVKLGGQNLCDTSQPGQHSSPRHHTGTQSDRRWCMATGPARDRAVGRHPLQTARR